jgi:hypothetical protein
LTKKSKIFIVKVGGKMFKIKDLNLDIKFAYLYTHLSVDDELGFFLKIKTEESENVFLGHPVCFNSEMLLKIKPNEINTWQEIAGKTFEWEEYDEEADIYIFEHEDVYNAKIEFNNIGDRMFVKINGFCNIYFDDEYSDNLPLEIETEINFYGVWCGKDMPKEDCEMKIKPFLDIEHFEYVQSKHGSAIMIPKGSNMETNLLVLGKF